jgi:uncharacterized cupin superfamily protein
MTFRSAFTAVFAAALALCVLTVPLGGPSLHAQGVTTQPDILPVAAATTANITLSGEQTIDGVSVVAGNRVLVKNQNTASENGVYVVAAGAWARSNDFRQTGQVVQGTMLYVNAGSTYAGHMFALSTANPINPGVTSLTFVAAPSGVPGALANPTGLLGIDAVNGTAATGMRSDGAPALSTEVTIPLASNRGAALVATTANITLSGAQTIDGVSVVAGNRVLVQAQTDTTENGIYVAAAGAWARSDDFNATNQIAYGTRVYVQSGATFGGHTLAIDTASPAIGSALAFVTQAQVTGTIATGELTAFPAATQTVFTSGYYTTNDGGGAQYARVATEPTWDRGKFRSADRYLPDGTVSSGDGGWWQLADLANINFLALGGKGDDDIASVEDNNAASIAANAIWVAQGRGKVFFPAGIYYVGTMAPGNAGSSILMESNTAIEGAGVGATIIKMDNISASSGIAAVVPGANGSGYPNSSEFTDIPLVTLTGAGSGARATITTGPGGAVSGITITYPGTGYALTDTVTVDNADTGGQGSGFVRVVDDLTNVAGIINMTGADNVTISNLSIDGDRGNYPGGAGQHCIRVGTNGVDNLRINKVAVRNCFTYGIGIQGADGTGVSNNLYLSEIFVENTGYDGIDIKNKGPAVSPFEPNRGTFLSDIHVKNPGIFEEVNRDPAGVDCRGPCNMTNITVTGLLTASLVMNRVGIRMRLSDDVQPGQIGARYASLTNFFIEGDFSGGGAGNITGVEIQGDESTVSNGTVKGATTAFRIQADNVSMTNLTGIDYEDRGFWYLNSPDYDKANYTTCTNCKAIQTALSGSSYGFYFADGTHASERPTGNTLINPVMINNNIGIFIDAGVLDTRILTPQFITNSTNVDDDSTSSALPTVWSWDLVTANGANVTAAATLVLNRTTGDTVTVAGNTGISAITLAEGRSRLLYFTGTPTITAGASLVLPTAAASIVVQAGDMALVRGFSGGVVRVMWYSRATGIPLDPDLAALAALNTNGMIARTGTDTWAARTITGTANEITSTNGDGVSANPTLSLPSALTFTGKTITGGTFETPTINTPAVNGATLGTNLINGVFTVPCTTTQVTHTGNTSETLVVTATIPAGTIGANGSVRVTVLGSRVSGAAGTITHRIRFGANINLAGTLYFASALATGDAQQGFRVQLTNRNSASSQIGNNVGAGGGWGISTAALVTSTVNTGNVAYVNISVQNSSAADTGGIEFCSVEILARS